MICFLSYGKRNGIKDHIIVCLLNALRVDHGVTDPTKFVSTTKIREEWQRINTKFTRHHNGISNISTQYPITFCHVNNERAIKDTSQAPFVAIGTEEPHGHILNLGENRSKIRTRQERFREKYGFSKSQNVI